MSVVSADVYVCVHLHVGIGYVGVVGSSCVPAFKPIRQEALWPPEEATEEDRGGQLGQGRGCWAALAALGGEGVVLVERTTLL